MKNRFSWTPLRIAMAIFSFLFAAGLACTAFAYLQKSYPAAVVDPGSVQYIPSKLRGRYRTSPKYSIAAAVTYTDGDGVPQEAEVEIIRLHSQDLPAAGDEILISRGINGMVEHPSRRIKGIGLFLQVFSALFLGPIIFYRYIRIRKKRA